MTPTPPNLAADLQGRGVVQEANMANDEFKKSIQKDFD
jgi:hypothetical protein